MNRFLSRSIPCAVLLAFLSACSSNVKLHDSVVENMGKSSQEYTASLGSGVDSREVSAIDIGDSNKYISGPESTSSIVYFDFDSFFVNPEFLGILETHAKYIKKNDSLKIVIEGHTDEKGGREYNLSLGQKRAEAVSRSLSLLGLNVSQAESVSFGAEKPAVPGLDNESMAKNRRAEIIYKK